MLDNKERIAAKSSRAVIELCNRLVEGAQVGLVRSSGQRQGCSGEQWAKPLSQLPEFKFRCFLPVSSMITGKLLTFCFTNEDPEVELGQKRVELERRRSQDLASFSCRALLSTQNEARAPSLYRALLAESLIPVMLLTRVTFLSHKQN